MSCESQVKLHGVPVQVSCHKLSSSLTRCLIKYHKVSLSSSFMGRLSKSHVSSLMSGVFGPGVFFAVPELASAEPVSLLYSILGRS